LATRSQSSFQTVKTEGALLPADLLKRVSDGDKEIEGLSPECYHLDPTDKINEATNRAWIACRDAWQRFQKQRADLPDLDKGTTLTRERWLLVLFRELGYGRLQTAKAFEIEDKTYALSHGWGASPIHLISFRYDLDTTSHGVFRTSPHSLVQELLNRSDDHLWAFVSNGLQLRILRDNVSFTRPAFVEFDLEAMMEGEVYSDFLLLWLLCHQSRVESDIPEQCWLEKWHQTAKKQGTRVLDRLRDGVQKSIEAFGQGFLAHRGNTALRQKLADGKLSTQEYYQQLLRLVYRLIFLFVAEDRDLLLTPSKNTKADATIRNRFEKNYSLTRIRRLSQRRRGTRHSDLWQGVKVVFKLLYKGEPRLGLPALGSMLFSDKTMPDLDGCELANDQMLAAVRHLAFTVERNVLRQVDYKNLGSEELGSVYESLLELHPDVNTDAATFELTAVAGSERKTTGSYYTPSSLINCLLDSALDPVVAEALKKPDREKAILDLKVCDPACGSGHFLIAAANRLSHHLATARTGDEEPSPAARRVAFRDCVSHCIYGVDINPMAVELCKVALWLESIDPGKPLSFLDHRILCGNSLIGVTPRLLAEGIPDAAFKPITGDDKAVVSEYKKRNKEERTGKGGFLFKLDGEARETALPWDRLGNLVQAFANLAAMDDGSLDDVEAKEKKYAECVESTGYLSARLLADAWCAAFVWKKDKDTDDCITESWFRRIEANPHCLPPWMREEIERLRDQCQLFHWHLAFPDAFRVPSENEDAENEQAGWSGGFDVVLGNPPWERIKIQEKEWFAHRRPDIANAPSAAKRRGSIAALEREDPNLYREFIASRRSAEGDSHFVRNSGRYPLCGRGDVNTYSIFAETKRLMVSPSGRIGCIVPSGIASDDAAKLFYQDLVESGALVSLYSFENEEFIFPAVHHAAKFCLLTLCGRQQSVGSARYVYYARQPVHLAENERAFSLTADDIALLNPETRTCPVFRFRRDADLTRTIYRHVSVPDFGKHDADSWEIRLFTMLHSSSAAHLFLTEAELPEGADKESTCWVTDAERYLPLYEGKMFSQFDHRSAGVQMTSNVSRPAQPVASSVAEHRDPGWVPSPRAWVAECEIGKHSPDLVETRWFLGFKDVTASTNERTFIAAFLPTSGITDSVNLVGIQNPNTSRDAALLLANFNSFVLDYVARQKIGGTHIKFYVVRQLPILERAAYEGLTLTFTHSTRFFVSERALELSYTAWDLATVARNHTYSGPPFRWDDDRRFLIRCELDAAYFHLYGIERDDVEYIMETFPIVKRKDIARTEVKDDSGEVTQEGRYITKDTILEIYDEMAEVMTANEAAVAAGRQPTARYQTRLVPPPGPPADAEGNFLPLPQWLPGQPQPPDWPSHIHSPLAVTKVFMENSK
jgi:Eco57I restriction-modification methylase